MRIVRALLFALIGLVAMAAFAVIGGYAFLQTGYGKAWLGRALSSLTSTATSKVEITGLSGTPPFDLHAASIRVDDRDGTWVELEDASLLIDGRALLHGTFVILHLRASMLHVIRSPRAGSSASSGPLDLSAPHLPIDVAVDDLAIDSLVLDPAVLGQAAKLTLQARARLAKGDADAHLTLRRTDGPPGEADLDLGLSGRPAILDLSGEVSDPSGALGRALMQRQEREPVAIRLAGRGPIADWHGRLEAQLGELAQLKGSISIAAAINYRFQLQAEARQNGLLPAEFVPLIGDRLKLDAVIDYDGKQAIQLDRLFLSAAAGQIMANGRVSGATPRLAASMQIAIPNLGLAQALLRKPLAGRLGIDLQLGGSVDKPSAKVGVEGHDLRLADVSLEGLAASVQLASETKEGARSWRAEGQGRLLGVTRGQQPLPSALGRDFDWSLAGDFDQAGRFADIDSISLTGASL